MTDYARDPQGRPVSEDGNWVWNGIDWEAYRPEITLTRPVVAEPVVYVPEPVPVVEPVPGGIAVEPVLSGYQPQHALAGGVHAPEVQQREPLMDFRTAVTDDEDDETESGLDIFPGFSSAPAPSSDGYAPAASRPSFTDTSGSSDEMSLGRLAATTTGVVLALGGALMLGVSIATILIMRAFQKAMENPTGADPFAAAEPASANTTIAMIYGVSFVVATLAAFSVLYAARVPKAIIGAAVIVVLSFAAFYGINKSGVQMQSWTGILLLPLVPAIATAGFVKWATR